jgi:hypothetical protein
VADDVDAGAGQEKDQAEGDELIAAAVEQVVGRKGKMCHSQNLAIVSLYNT